jgi:hypothetical protein
LGEYTNYYPRPQILRCAQNDNSLDIIRYLILYSVAVLFSKFFFVTLNEVKSLGVVGGFYRPSLRFFPFDRLRVRMTA